MENYEGKEIYVDGYIESVMPETLGDGELGKMVYSMIRDAFLVGYDHGDGMGYQRGRQEGYDMESELAQQFSEMILKKEVK